MMHSSKLSAGALGVSAGETFSEGPKDHSPPRATMKEQHNVENTKLSPLNSPLFLPEDCQLSIASELHFDAKQETTECVGALHLHLLHPAKGVGMVSLKSLGSDSVIEELNVTQDLPVSIKGFKDRRPEVDGGEKALVVCEGTSFENLCSNKFPLELREDKRSLSSNSSALAAYKHRTCLSTPKLGKIDDNFHSLKAALAEVHHIAADTHRDGRGAMGKKQDKTLQTPNLATKTDGIMPALQDAEDAKSLLSVANFNGSMPIVRHATCTPHNKRCRDAQILELKHQVKMLRQSAIMDLAQAMVILSHCTWH